MKLVDLNEMFLETLDRKESIWVYFKYKKAIEFLLYIIVVA